MSRGDALKQVNHVVDFSPRASGMSRTEVHDTQRKCLFLA